MIYTKTNAKKAWKKKALGMKGEFYVPSCPVQLPEYHPLSDPHLEHYWSYPSVQTHLRRAGLLDKTGSPIDIEKFRAKERIVAREWERLETLNRRQSDRAFWRVYSEQIRRNRQNADERRKADVAHFRNCMGVSIM